VLAFPVASAHADDWTVGPGVAYVSNINHVIDIYKADVRAQGKTVDVDKALPVGRHPLQLYSQATPNGVTSTSRRNRTASGSTPSWPRRSLIGRARNCRS